MPSRRTRAIPSTTTMSLPINQSLKTQIPPHRLMAAVHSARNAERGVLVWDNVVFVFGVWRLELWLDIDVFYGEEGGHC